MRAVLATLVVLAVSGTAAIAAIRPAVLPMQARVFVEQPSQSLAIQFSGRVPGARNGDRVVMLVRDCQSRHFRQVGGTWTVQGGGSGGVPLAGSGSTYQARWRGRPTAPFTFRTRLKPFIWKYNATEFGTWIALAFEDPLVALGGRAVAVQRLTENGWVTIRTLRLRTENVRRFEARFTVATPGLTLRVLAPTPTARPCYNAGASDIVRSG